MIIAIPKCQFIYSENPQVRNCIFTSQPKQVLACLLTECQILKIFFWLKNNTLLVVSRRSRASTYLIQKARTRFRISGQWFLYKGGIIGEFQPNRFLKNRFLLVGFYCTLRQLNRSLQTSCSLLTCPIIPAISKPLLIKLGLFELTIC